MATDSVGAVAAGQTAQIEVFGKSFELVVSA
jgi:hypothetical protein